MQLRCLHTDQLHQDWELTSGLVCLELMRSAAAQMAENVVQLQLCLSIQHRLSQHRKCNDNLEQAITEFNHKHKSLLVSCSN